MDRSFALDTTSWLGQGRRLDLRRALASRPSLSLVETRAGQVRIRRQPAPRQPRVVFAADGPNVIEHYDGLVAALDGRADVTVFDPPGTGGSAARRGFDFSIDSFADATIDVLEAAGGGARILVMPCYLGFVGLRVKARRPDLVERLVMPQTPTARSFGVWADRVDRRRWLRTPFVGQVLVAVTRAKLADTWYRNSAVPSSRSAFSAAAREAFAFGGCFCLASLMQALSTATPGGDDDHDHHHDASGVVLWGEKDRSHRGSSPYGADVVRLAERGHSPELEAPGWFADWLLEAPAGSRTMGSP